jgi:hypothetical protein
MENGRKSVRAELHFCRGASFTCSRTSAINRHGI